MDLNNKVWLKKYFEEYKTPFFSEEIYGQIVQLANLFSKIREEKKRVFICGNGGSVSIANHCVLDLVNKAKVRAFSFNDPGIITCYTNDYGYEEWLTRSLDLQADPGDAVILISSSGQSKNMIAAARVAIEKKLNIVTVSGFKADNPLRGFGQINLWIDSSNYNIVENTHQVWLLAAVDLLVSGGDIK